MTPKEKREYESRLKQVDATVAALTRAVEVAEERVCVERAHADRLRASLASAKITLADLTVVPYVARLPPDLRAVFLAGHALQGATPAQVSALALRGLAHKVKESGYRAYYALTPRGVSVRDAIRRAELGDEPRPGSDTSDTGGGI